MFYKMIENKCTQWYESDQCIVKNLIEYIKKTGQMRDAQIEAIKVYLFLKIACESKPLMQLFRQGFFNSIDVTIQYPVKYILIFRQNRENKISQVQSASNAPMRFFPEYLTFQLQQERSAAW